jgi:hypothetical protein
LQEEQDDYHVQQALDLVRGLSIISHDSLDQQVLHIDDRQPGQAPSAYLATFLDLFIASQARCIVFDVGNFGSFYAKIAGTSCKVLYTEESWKQDFSRIYKREHTPCCSKGLLVGVGLVNATDVNFKDTFC